VIHFLNVMVYSVLLITALWFGKRALKAVGIYRFSRAAVGGHPRALPAHVCADESCPGAVLTSVMAETHRKVRIEALWAVLIFLAPLTAATYTFVLLMGRLA
jgi:hypothetical protein